MGYRANGVCYDTEEDAFEHWSAQFPIVQDGKVYSLYDTVKNYNGNFSYTLFDGATSTAMSPGTLVMQPCDASYMPLTDLPQASLWFIAVLAFAFFFGFKTSFKP